MKQISEFDGKDLPPLPLLPHLWAAIACRLKLAPREKQTVELILRHQQYKEIAHRLGISPGTVETYVRRVYHRVGVDDREALVLRIFAESHGLGPSSGPCPAQP
jgi:DNA-binding CsgD family transcriptional regulator